MEAILYYLLKVSAANGIMVLAWLIFFRKDNILNLNRTYFLTSITLPWIFPLLNYRINFLTSTGFSESVMFMSGTGTDEVSGISGTAGMGYADIVMIVYMIVTILFIMKMFTGLVLVLKIIGESKKDHRSGYSVYGRRDDILPFSFFNRLVICEKYVSFQGLDLVIAHERAHSEKWHSLDVLLFSFFRAVLWFNPFAWYVEKLAKANHEYIADREVVRSNPDQAGDYRKLLVSLGAGISETILVNNFNHNQLIKRIAMMKNVVKTKKPGPKYLLMFPLLALLSMTFCTKEIAERITPYYYIDGVLSNADDLNHLNPDRIETIKVINDPTGTEYENPENMKVVIVTTSEGGDGEGQEGDLIDNGEKPAGTGIKIRMNEVENLSAGESIEVIGYMREDTTGIHIPDTDSFDFRSGFDSDAMPKPLIYLDGKLYEGEIQSLDPSKIEKIEVIKGEQAVIRTGNEVAGYAGALIITIKN